MPDAAIGYPWQMIGFHASHEQMPPSQLLADVVAAEQAGFQAAMCSDHFAPWSVRQGHSGFAWSWLGAALEATQFSLGVVTAPGQRYHPAISAQAIATLAEMYPGRFWAALGSGENVNEHITGDAWPDKPTRDARLHEVAGIMQRLLAGEEVTHDGLVRVDRAQLWSLPDQPPRLIGAAVSAPTAAAVAGWADGLITVARPTADLRPVIDAFRSAGGDGKPVYLQQHLSWAADDESARGLAHDQWRSNVFPASLAWNLAHPEQFDDASTHVRPDDVAPHVRISSDLGRHVGWIEELLELEPDGIYLHHVGQEQREFIDAFGTDVLPKLTA
ncbi:MAG TPA: TIGR03885 family FMN-dependent LLM class oxidoreductase [Ilumatobacter sp.]|nr:TIGR03885 family FMN-dependent LLM class oxidoreductase [Ilumatobacter sp.]